MHCITCKKIIAPDERHHTSPDGWAICLSCQNPCGMDVLGIVYHHDCPDGCFLVDTWEEVENGRKVS